MSQDLLKKAVNLCVTAHEGQTRKGATTPYHEHPLNVMETLNDFTKDSDILAAALLHDVVEDSDYSLDFIRQEFSDNIASLVEEVTEIKYRNGKKLPWATRKREHLEKLERQGSPGALMIKVADHISNLDDMINSFGPADINNSQFNSTIEERLTYSEQIWRIARIKGVDRKLTALLRFMICLSRKYFCISPR